MIRADAFAKVNLSLRVGRLTGSGLHEVHGLFQSIDWADALALDAGDEDRITGRDTDRVIDGRRNLAWQAVEVVRDQAGSRQAFHLELHKRIPVAAGLGGGSADAAAALSLTGRFFGMAQEDVAALGPRLGSDVPFCLEGGLAAVSGTGHRVSALSPAVGFGLALVVPPVEISTAAVYAAWDRLNGPGGPEVGGRDLPPGLRDHGPLANDLYAAAVATAPAIDEWRAELAIRWERPVMLTGSGPTLFAYFVDADEARDALSDIPIGARAAEAVVPVDRGWRIESRESRAENRD